MKRAVSGVAWRWNRLRAGCTKRSYWQTIALRHLWRRPVFFTDRYGVTLSLYPDDCLETIFESKSHNDDPSVLLCARRLLKPGMTLIDVGANYGQFTVFAAPLVGQLGRVHAFEPCSYAYSRLCENVRRLPDPAKMIYVNQKAVCKESGEVVIHEYPQRHSAWNSLSPHPMWSGNWIEPIASEKVPAVSLDDYCKTCAVDVIDLLKIDVEGFEVDVLEGSARLIREGRIRSVIFELSLEPLQGASRTPEGVFQAISTLGFEIKRILADGDLEPVSKDQFSSTYFANYFAVPRMA
jgi:FkbM family methyltransferase